MCGGVGRGFTSIFVFILPTCSGVEMPSPTVGVAMAHSPMQHVVAAAAAQIPNQQQTQQLPVSAPNSDGRRSKTRTSINPMQLEVLMQTYLQEQRPSKQTREDLMAKTGLDMKVGMVGLLGGGVDARVSFSLSVQSQWSSHLSFPH